MRINYLALFILLCSSVIASRAQGISTLGVGINNPVGTLHVNSSVRIESDAGITPMSLAPTPNHYKSSIYLTNAKGGTTQDDGFSMVLYDNELTMRHKEYGNINLFGYSGQGLMIDVDGNVGIGTSSPDRRLHVYGGSFLEGDVEISGCTTIGYGFQKLSCGVAFSEDLAWGSSYIGFNATRIGQQWRCVSDSRHNGGAVIWATMDGDILFANIPSSGGVACSVSDLDVKNNINLKLGSDGKLYAKGVVVTLNDWPDYVFDDNYEMRSLGETEQYIKENGHLPGVPSAAEVETSGIELGEMNRILLQKIEELTLQLIELQNKINEITEE